MKKIKYNIIVFPGSNCDKDISHIVENIGDEYEFIWHKEKELKAPDIVVIPGGFSFGDYLRCGALAKFSNIMPAIIKYAQEGGFVLGICNGFQILTEAGLLPGALLKNNSQKFICQHQLIKVVNNNTAFSCEFQHNEVTNIPIAHMDGRYFIDKEGYKKLVDNNQIVFKYDTTNPNGSVKNIAGITNIKGNVLGMMPHPERSIITNNSKVLQMDSDKKNIQFKGLNVFRSFKKWITNLS